jgi:hypothetical protein
MKSIKKSIMPYVASILIAGGSAASAQTADTTVDSSKVKAKATDTCVCLPDSATIDSVFLSNVDKKHQPSVDSVEITKDSILTASNPNIVNHKWSLRKLFRVKDSSLKSIDDQIAYGQAVRDTLKAVNEKYLDLEKGWSQYRKYADGRAALKNALLFIGYQPAVRLAPEYGDVKADKAVIKPFQTLYKKQYNWKDDGIAGQVTANAIVSLINDKITTDIQPQKSTVEQTYLKNEALIKPLLEKAIKDAEEVTKEQRKVLDCKLADVYMKKAAELNEAAKRKFNSKDRQLLYNAAIFNLGIASKLYAKCENLDETAKADQSMRETSRLWTDPEKAGCKDPKCPVPVDTVTQPSKWKHFWSTLFSTNLSDTARGTETQAGYNVANSADKVENDGTQAEYWEHNITAGTKTQAAKRYDLGIDAVVNQNLQDLTEAGRTKASRSTNKGAVAITGTYHVNDFLHMKGEAGYQWMTRSTDNKLVDKTFNYNANGIFVGADITVGSDGVGDVPGTVTGFVKKSIANKEYNPKLDVRSAGDDNSTLMFGAKLATPTITDFADVKSPFWKGLLDNTYLMAGIAREVSKNQNLDATVESTDATGSVVLGGGNDKFSVRLKATGHYNDRNQYLGGAKAPNKYLSAGANFNWNIPSKRR